MRILLIDDDVPSTDALREILESEGHAVETAADGQAGLETLKRSQRFCVILLDIMMPVMNGYEFRVEQLKDPKLAAIPVIVLTADGRARDRAAELSAKHIFQKPLSPSDLLTAIKEYC